MALVVLTRDKVDNGWCGVCKGPAALLSAPWGYCQNRDKLHNQEDTTRPGVDKVKPKVWFKYSLWID